MALKKKVSKEVSQEEVAPEVKEAEIKEKMEEAVANDEPVAIAYADPTDYVYELKAGKTFQGLCYDDVMDVVDGLLGKVETITIKRKNLIAKA